MSTKELTSIEEMVLHHNLIVQLYPKMTLEKYTAYLFEMIPHRYKQLAVFEHDVCVALTGFWTGYKLWTGKYIEIDNFIVDENHRQKGLGKLMTDYISVKASAEGCTAVVLDAFTANFKAHRFYYNQGYEPRGFHFIKTIHKDGFS